MSGTFKKPWPCFKRIRETKVSHQIGDNFKREFTVNIWRALFKLDLFNLKMVEIK